MEVEDLYRLEGDDSAVLNVVVQPRAGRSAVVGRHGSALKVRVAAPPEGGRANEACRALLAETFRAGGVELVGGASSRSKRFRLTGIDADELRRRLEQLLGDGQGEGGPTPGSRGDGKRRRAW